MKSTILLGLSGLAVLGVSSIALAENYGEAKLALSVKEPFGEYLTDSEGRALYMFAKDKKGQSTCYEDCAKVWPPFAASDEKIRAEGVNKGLIDMVERKDGMFQITYNGMPLYYYIKDKGKPGSTKGHDVHDEFGTWYLVAPSGKKVAEQPESKTKALGAEQEGGGTKQKSTY